MALTGSPPFEAAQRQELYWHIRAARYPQPGQLSPHAQALIAHLLAPEPAARPSLQDMVDHGFFTQVRGRCGARPRWGRDRQSLPLAPQGFTPHRLPPRACHSVPIFVGQALLCRLRQRLCQEHQNHVGGPGSPRCHPGTLPPPPHEGAGSEPRKHPLRKIFISARNCLKSSHRHKQGGT
ncbi:inactive serine/threonine-protein kinase PLK5 [Strigops habroptila]|uniref:inactive serine/threonine-protein kinase PLK5 n=1 Tax=Strigops habroptila TaxID=2489341 RepID=UPI0011D02507|nr:inactive serine/threonine-protein kinase PLK5 [Strigops habroptila]